MNNCELAKQLIDQIPESKMYYIVSFLQRATVSEKTPIAETLKAMAEIEEMIKNGTEEHFEGSTSDLLAMLSEE